MEPTIKVLDNALRGDFGALSVLEKTASIYILDATNGLNATPITYGCWNFLNQALTEVERYEQQQQKQLYNLQSSQHGPHHGHSVMPSLESHVQLLCSMSRKAARRPPPSDRRLIGICLSNAAKSYGNQLLSTPEAQKQMMDLNCQTRERVMGRIAAMVFDFSFHPSSTGNINTTTRGQFQSAFSNPVAMEGLCAILSANAISNGPSSIKEFVMDWIVPSVKHLPPFAVACIVLHLAKEVMEKSAPYGTEQELQNLSIAVVGNVLGPLLVDALRESDESNDNNNNNLNLTGSSFSSSSVKVLTRNQRLATISLQALERWCCATNMNFVHLNHICNSTQINIVEVISDALYSHNDFILDAAAEFLATLLQQDNSTTSVVEQTTTTTTKDLSNHHYFLNELATAIGLQRFRFMERQAIGDNGTCRCLSRIASTIAISFRRNVTSDDDKEENIPDGLLDILLKATSHSVLNVSSIAIDALNFLLQSSAPHAQNVALSNRFLPILQEKSIYPNSVLNELTSTNDNDEDEDMTMTTSGDTNNTHRTTGTTTTTESFQEFNEFRQNCLAEALCSCYIMNPQLYLESSANALESLCNSTSQINNQPTVTSTSQIEGVLFCLGVVSVEVTKKVTLTKQQQKGEEALLFQNPPQDSSSSSNNTENLLNRCILALASAPSHPTSNPLTLAQMCNFLGKYADLIASESEESQSQIQMQTPKSNIILDSAADLSLRSFKLASTAFRDNKQTKNIMDKMSVSPFAEAAIALRNILSRKPSHFTTSHALTALAGAWESAYCDSSTTLSKSSLGEKTPVYRVEDRKAISSGICRVLASLPSEQWVASLIALSRPTIENLEIAIRKADDLMLRHTTRRSGNDVSSSSASKDVLLNGILSRAAEEIVLLSTMTKTFNESTLIPQASGTTPAPAISVTFMNNKNPNNQDQHKILPEEEGEKGPPKDHPSLALLRASWPCLSHLAKKYSSFDQINESLGEFLESSVSSSPGKNNKPHTNSVSMIDHHGNGISILKELCDMAATITSVLTNNQLHNHDSSSSPLTPIFPFIIRVLETYGQEAELIKNNPSTNSPPVVASSSQIIEIRLIIKRLLTITVESMSSSVGQLWLSPPTILYGKKKENKNDHQQQQKQGQNPYECPSSPEQHEDKLSSPSHQPLQFSMNSVFMLPPTSASGESGGGKNTSTGAENNNNNDTLRSQKNNRNKSAESLSRFFDILSCCIEKCPNLLINLERQFGDNQEGLLQKSVSVAILVMVEKEIDIARSSMIFLKSLIDLRYKLLSCKTMDMMVEEVKPSALSSSNTIQLEDYMITHVITSRIRNNLIEKLLLGSFGNFSRESLDSAALLLLSLLRKEPPHDDNDNVDDDEEEKDVNTAVLNICRGFSRNQQFVLGEGALTITMGVLQQCSDEKIPSDYLIEFLTDIWDMHQTDDIGSLAGGNVVKRFEEKYKVLLSS